MALTDTLRSQGPGFTATELFDTLDALRASVDFTYEDAVDTTTSASYVDMSSMSRSITVPAGSIVEVIFSTVLSIDAPSTIIAVGLHQNGTLIGGGDTALTVMAQYVTYPITLCALLEAPATGSVTYAAKWKRVSGSGTLSSVYRRISLKVHRIT